MCSVIVLYALMTWLYECFHAVPYLRFLGIHGSGKARGSEVAGSICNRGLFMSGATTVAALFRQIEVIGGTLILDEADFAHTNIGSEIAKILNCGFQKGMAVVRNDKDANGNWVPRYYDVFGPKILNRRRSFQDASIDLDSTITESWKQQAKATYGECDGYQPMLAVWAEMNVIVADEFRDGNSGRTQVL